MKNAPPRPFEQMPAAGRKTSADLAHRRLFPLVAAPQEKNQQQDRDGNAEQPKQYIADLATLA